MQITDNSITIEANEVGSEFLTELVEVLKVRIDRRKQYGDTYLEDDEIFLRMQIENKLKRLKINFENEKVSIDPDKRATAKDSLRDLVNYSIFLLAKIEKNEK